MLLNWTQLLNWTNLLTGRIGIGIIQGELKMLEPKHREVRFYKNVNGGISPGGA